MPDNNFFKQTNYIFTDLRKKLGNRWATFQRLHQIIISLNSKIKFRIFPIYINYFIEENVIAIIYFKGKLVSDSQLDVGFALKEKPKISGFIEAGYMRYPRITYSIKIDHQNNITKNFSKIIKSTMNYNN